MSSASRQERGRQTELIGAKYFRENLWPDCKATAASLPGKDLQNTPGAAVEIKARSKFSPTAWIRQSIRNSGSDIPMVLMRPIGYGPERIDDWLMFMRNRDFVDLWRKAYGGGGSKRSVKRSSREKGGDDPIHHYRLRVEPRTDNSSGPLLEGVVSSILHSMGFEPGDYEMEIRKRQSSPSSSRV